MRLLTLKSALLTAILALLTAVNGAEVVKIAPNSPLIYCGGSYHIEQRDGSMILNRHSRELFDGDNILINKLKADTPSGVYIEFKTASRVVEPLFSAQEGGTLRAPLFSIYCDGKALGLKNIKNLKLENTSGNAVTWRIYAPVMYALVFDGLNLDTGAELLPLEKVKRPVYVAIGDSISHGVGQTDVGSDKTYPAILAALKGWEMYNLAVGGSSITPAIAQEFDNEEVDYITILWGYNDWCFRSESYENMEGRYSQLLESLREDHPKALIYAILPLFSTNPKSKRRSAEFTLQGVRDLQRSAIEAQIESGDKRLYLVDGEAITTADDLNDLVHLNPAGAKRLAQKLCDIIK